MVRSLASASLLAALHLAQPESATLRNETAVLPQQTTPAQGSPFIRGLSAQRILYLIDGVRFNTSSFRSGATQFLAWVSPTVVDRMEVLRGPASVQYGSDALGGTIQLLTVRPALRRGGRSARWTV